MKKIIKKIFIILIVFILVFEFSFSNSVNAAFESISEEELNVITNLIGGIVSIVLWIPRILMTAMAFMINKVTYFIANSQRCCGYWRW